MIKVLFVCHGNICRSTMAQYVMQDLVTRHGLAEHFYINSAAISMEEIGNPVSDYDKYDYIIGMDSWNRRNMMRILGKDPEGKVSLLLDYTDHPRDIADPWYTGNFDATYDDVKAGCEALLTHIRETEGRK